MNKEIFRGLCIAFTLGLITGILLAGLPQIVDFSRITGLAVTDITSPVINSVSDSPDPIEQNQSIEITANITDNTRVGSVWVEIEGINYTMTNQQDGSRQIIEFIDFENPDAEIQKWSKDSDAPAYPEGKFEIVNETHNFSNNLTFTTRSGEHVMAFSDDTFNKLAYANRPVDLSGYRDVKISMWKAEESTENPDQFKAYYWDGGSWIEMWSDADAPDDGFMSDWEEKVYNILDSAATSDFQIQIRWETTEACPEEHMFIDDISITGIPIQDTWKLAYDTTGKSSSVAYTVYAEDISGNKAEPQSGEFFVITAENEDITISEIIENAETEPINATIEWIDENGQLSYSHTGTTHNYKIKRGRYKIAIKPESHPIKKIEIEKDLQSDIDQMLDIDYDAAPDTEFSQIYAVDPQDPEIENATVTITATGTELFKCKDWDFENRECDGEWIKLMDTTPDEEYSFTVDCGYKEKGGCSCKGIRFVDLASDYNFINGSNYNVTVEVFNGANTNPGSLIDSETINFNSLPQTYIDNSPGSLHGNLIIRKINETNIVIKFHNTSKKKLAGEDTFRITINSNTLGPDTIHLSCSQPIGIGDVFGNFTVVDIDKILSGSDCTLGTVNLLNPANNTSTNQTNVTFEYGVYDSNQSISYCELIINGSSYQTDYSIEEGVSQDFSQTLSSGTYSWGVRCTTSNGYEIESEKRILGIQVIGTIIFQETVEDAKHNPINTTIEFVNETGAVVYSETATTHSATIKKGIYTIKVKPVGHIVKGIFFGDYNVTEDIDDIVDIDDTSESISSTEQNAILKEIYSIDPKLKDFITANITATAKDRKLYKCSYWDFSDRRCYGRWIKVMDLTEGENYSFIMTPGDPAFGEGSEKIILTTIIIDGNITDWDAVIDNPNNIFGDGHGSLNDPLDLDTGMNADNDLSRFAFTWDNEKIYFYFERVFTAQSVSSGLIYLDLDHDGYMNSTDKVIKITGVNPVQGYNSYIYDYVPNATADILTGDGTAMPGTVTNEVQTGSGVQGIEPNGIILESEVNWSTLNISAGSPLKLHVSIAKAQANSLPSNVEDNLAIVDTAVADALITPNSNIKSVVDGATVSYNHTITNLGNIDDIFDITSIGTNNWTVQIYYQNGTPLTDTDSDSIVDVGTLARNQSVGIIVNLTSVITGNTTIDYTTITARSSYNTNVSDSASDITTAGTTTIFPPRVGKISPNSTIKYNHTIQNNKLISDTIDVSAVSDQGWTVNVYYINGTPLTDTDSDTIIDVGSLSPGDSADIIVSITVPNASIATLDKTTITANSSVDGNYSAVTDKTTIAKRVSIEPLNTNILNVGIGTSVFYEFEVSNNWNESDVIDINYSSSQGWPVELFEWDYVTLLTDTNNNSVLDIGTLGTTGDSAILVIKVTVPEGTPPNTTDTTTITGTSSLDNSAYDTSFANTTSVVVLTYNDSARTQVSDLYLLGDIIYAAAYSISVNKIDFHWLDANATLVKESSEITVPPSGKVLDQYASNISTDVPGRWAVIIHQTPQHYEIVRHYFNVSGIPANDTTSPAVTLISPANNSIDTDGYVTFYYNVTDPETGIAYCQLIINSSVSHTDYSITENTTQSFSKNLANGTYNWSINCKNTANITGSSKTRILHINLTALAGGLCCCGLDVSVTPKVVIEEDKALVAADVTNILTSTPATPADISNITASIYRVENGTSTTVVDKANMTFLDNGLWYYEFFVENNLTGTYMASVAMATNQTPSFTKQASYTFSVGEAAGGLFVQGVSPDLINTNETTRVAAEVYYNSIPIPSSQLVNATLSIELINGSVQFYNTSNYLQVGDGLLYLDGSFNATGVYYLNWTVYYKNHLRSAKEVVVVVDWGDKIDNLNISGEIIELIKESRKYLIELLSNMEMLQQFNEEEVFLVTDSVNSMSQIIEHLEEGKITEKEAELQFDEIQQRLRNTLGDVTGHAVKSEDKWSERLGENKLIIIITFILVLLFAINRFTKGQLINKGGKRRYSILLDKLMQKLAEKTAARTAQQKQPAEQKYKRRYQVLLEKLARKIEGFKSRKQEMPEKSETINKTVEKEQYSLVPSIITAKKEDEEENVDITSDGDYIKIDIDNKTNKEKNLLAKKKKEDNKKEDNEKGRKIRVYSNTEDIVEKLKEVYEK